MNEKTPIWLKYTLTIAEACDNINIGESRLRQILMENPSADYILMNGHKYLIKRKKFE